MVGERNRALRLVGIGGPGWASGPVEVAFDRRRRIAGLRPVAGPGGLMVRSRSIHTFGMRDPIVAVAFSDRGVVRRVQVVEPNRVWVDPGARLIVELSPRAATPSPGDALTVAPILDPWPAR